MNEMAACPWIEVSSCIKMYSHITLQL